MINELQSQWDGLSPKEQKEIANFVSRKMQKASTESAKLLLARLNEAAGRNYRPVTANLSRIQARLAEGYTYQEIEQVIARKCLEWYGNPQMEQYLRPKTLFAAENFAQYVGQLDMKIPEKEKPKLKRPTNDADWLVLAKKAGCGNMDGYEQIWQKATSLYDAGRLQI